MRTYYPPRAGFGLIGNIAVGILGAAATGFLSFLGNVGVIAGVIGATAGAVILLASVLFSTATTREPPIIRQPEATNNLEPQSQSSHVSDPSPYRAVFLSYRRDDAPDITGRLYDKLTGSLGREAVFKDIDSIPLGSDFRAHIGDNLQSCKVFLLIIGKKWLEVNNELGRRRIDDPRDLVRLEVEAALQRKIPVIPILVHGASIPMEDALPEGIRGIAYRQAIQLRPDPDFHRDADRIVSFLASTL